MGNHIQKVTEKELNGKLLITLQQDIQKEIDREIIEYMIVEYHRHTELETELKGLLSNYEGSVVCEETIDEISRELIGFYHKNFRTWAVDK